MRSTGQGLGVRAAITSCASRAENSRCGSRGFPSAGGAPRITCTGRLARSAVCRRAAARSNRFCHSGAAAQPSSITRIIGPSPVKSQSGFSTGRAAVAITSAAIDRRNSVIHQGADRGVVSSPFNPNKSRIAGKRMRFGDGGINRSRSHNTGRIATPSNIQGAVKAKGPRLNICAATSVLYSRHGTARYRSPSWPVPGTDPYDAPTDPIRRPARRVEWRRDAHPICFDRTGAMFRPFLR